jgi:hypothetical protein
VVYGKATTGAVDLGALGSGGTRIDGATAGDGAGDSVSWADVNGDSKPDVLVRAPGANSSKGATYAIFGPPPASVDLATLTANGYRIDGTTGDGGPVVTSTTTTILNTNVNVTFGSITASSPSATFPNTDFAALDVLAPTDLLTQIIGSPLVASEPRAQAGLQTIRDGGGPNPSGLDYLAGVSPAQAEHAFGPAAFQAVKPSGVTNIFDVADIYTHSYNTQLAAHSQTNTPAGSATFAIIGGITRVGREYDVVTIGAFTFEATDKHVDRLDGNVTVSASKLAGSVQLPAAASGPPGSGSAGGGSLGSFGCAVSALADQPQLASGGVLAATVSCQRDATATLGGTLDIAGAKGKQKGKRVAAAKRKRKKAPQAQTFSLTPARVSLIAGKPVAVQLRLGTGVAAVKKALSVAKRKRGAKRKKKPGAVSAKVNLTATDAAGNSGTASTAIAKITPLAKTKKKKGRK